MVFVCSGALSQEGARYRVYLNQDNHNEQRFYLRVTHILKNGSRNFRAGTYKSKEEALEALKKIDPEHPKRLKTKVGSVDLYSNGSWRVRAKHNGEVLHIGYFKTKEEAEYRLKEVIADSDFLQQRYENLLKKRMERKRRARGRADAYSDSNKRRKVASDITNAWAQMNSQSAPHPHMPQPHPQMPQLKIEEGAAPYHMPPPIIMPANFYQFQTPVMPMPPKIEFWNTTASPAISPPLFDYFGGENQLPSMQQESFFPRTENRVLTIELDDTPSLILVPSYVKKISYDDLKVLILSQDRDLYFNLISRDLHYVHGSDIRLAETMSVNFEDLPQSVRLF